MVSEHISNYNNLKMLLFQYNLHYQEYVHIINYNNQKMSIILYDLQYLEY